MLGALHSAALPHAMPYPPCSSLQIVVGDIGLLAVLGGLSFLGYQHGFAWLFKVR